MTRQIISIETAAEMVNNSDSELINCRLACPESEGFWFCEETQEFMSGDWVEGEGGDELITDREGNILRYDGYYYQMDENGNWSE